MMTPNDISNAKRDLMMNILNSIKETLDSKGLNELTFFEEENVPTLNFVDVPHTTYNIDEDTEYLLIRKVIKVNGIWGFIYYDTYMQSDEFIKPLTGLSRDFKQAQALHNYIYSIVVCEHNPLEHKERIGDLATLEALKKEMEGK